jgi:hypothetical protein
MSHHNRPLTSRGPGISRLMAPGNRHGRKETCDDVQGHLDGVLADFFNFKSSHRTRQDSECWSM